MLLIHTLTFYIWKIFQPWVFLLIAEKSGYPWTTTVIQTSWMKHNPKELISCMPFHLHRQNKWDVSNNLPSPRILRDVRQWDSSEKPTESKNQTCPPHFHFSRSHSSCFFDLSTRRVLFVVSNMTLLYWKAFIIVSMLQILNNSLKTCRYTTK